MGRHVPWVLPTVANSTAKEVPHNENNQKQEAASGGRPLVYDYDLKSYVKERPMREISFPFLDNNVAFNPFTTFIGMFILWGTCIWCILEPDTSLEYLLTARENLSRKFGWFIIISKPVTVAALIFFAFRYRNIRLGGKDAKPEFKSMEYFAMVFASGVAVGIYYYGVSEPLRHQADHWLANPGYRSQDEIDQIAMNLSVFHWGLCGWSTYVTVALSAGLASYQFGLPLIFRSSFYPIFGEYTWGWIGDVIDGVSIVVTVAGVCTSLGIGSFQTVAGLQRIGFLDSDLDEDDQVKAQIVVIWLVSIVSTASVLLGVSVGIKYLSLTAFCTGLGVTLVLLLMEHTTFLLDLQVQTLGNYLQEGILRLSFNTDAFGQLRHGQGRAIDGGGGAVWWMNTWTVFYWNWWSAWSCFVGLFIARISYGRTVGEVVFFTLIAPVLYCILWFSVWGGIGLRQARQALELQKLGGDYFNDSSYFATEDNSFCFQVPQQDVIVGNETIFTNALKGITPVCLFESTDEAAFNILYSFRYPDDFESGFGPLLSCAFLFSITIFFATSSDSGSLVVDFLAANGRNGTHWIQRLFWAMTEATFATALLLAGGEDSFAALQAAAITCGFPYTILLLFLLQTVYEMGEQALEGNTSFQFRKRNFYVPVYGGIFNLVEYAISHGEVHPDRTEKGMHICSKFQFYEFWKGLFLPFISLHQVLSSMNHKPRYFLINRALVAIFTVLYFASIIFLLLGATVKPPFRPLGWTSVMINAFILSRVKYRFRQKRRLHGNVFADFMSSLILYPQVLTQIRVEQMKPYQAEEEAQRFEQAKRRADQKQQEKKSGEDSGDLESLHSHDVENGTTGQAKVPPMEEHARGDGRSSQEERGDGRSMQVSLDNTEKSGGASHLRNDNDGPGAPEMDGSMISANTTGSRRKKNNHRRKQPRSNEGISPSVSPAMPVNLAQMVARLKEEKICSSVSVQSADPSDGSSTHVSAAQRISKEQIDNSSRQNHPIQRSRGQHGGHDKSRRTHKGRHFDADEIRRKFQQRKAPRSFD